MSTTPHDPVGRATRTEGVAFTEAGRARLDALAESLAGRAADGRNQSVVDVLDAVLNGDLDALCRAVRPAEAAEVVTGSTGSGHLEHDHLQHSPVAASRRAGGDGR